MRLVSQPAYDAASDSLILAVADGILVVDARNGKMVTSFAVPLDDDASDINLIRLPQAETTTVFFRSNTTLRVFELTLNRKLIGGWMRGFQTATEQLVQNPTASARYGTILQLTVRKEDNILLCHSVSIRTAKLLWTSSSSERALDLVGSASAPLVLENAGQGGLVFILGRNNGAAFSLKTGEIVWEAHPLAPSKGEPVQAATDSESIYIRYSNAGKTPVVSSLDINTGKVRWVVPTPVDSTLGTSPGSLVVDAGGVIYASADEGSQAVLFSISKDGHLISRMPFGGYHRVLFQTGNVVPFGDWDSGALITYGTILQIWYASQN
jgi:outer membrane protein assembly factor BamB